MKDRNSMKKDNNISRTDKALRNVKISFFMQIVALFISFICRTVFTKTMGAEYLGVSGLFTNILTILSFAELGIGSAIVFRLYEPLAQGNENKIRQYMGLYKRVYNLIVVVITLVGICLIPFLKYLVSAPNVRESVTLLYGLYLANTVASYIYTYKKSLLIADQNDYIVSIITQTVTVIISICQCVFLVLTRNFVIYCIWNCVSTLSGNILCSIYVNKKYKYLNETIDGKLTDREIKGLFKDVKGLLLTKITSVIFSGTDNLFISAFIGIKYVGILSNYTLILTMFNNIMNKIFFSLTSSIGNLAVNKEKKEIESVLLKMYFINTSIYGVMCIGMVLLIQEFVSEIWLDSLFYLPIGVIASAVMELFLRSIHFPIHTVQNALGLFSQYRVIYVLSALLNIVLDFILVKPFGITGLYIATIMCRGITYIVDICVVYFIGLKMKPTQYVLYGLKWFIFVALNFIISSRSLKYILIQGILGFGLRIIIVVLIYIITYLVFFSKDENFKFFITLVLEKIMGRE